MAEGFPIKRLWRITCGWISGGRGKTNHGHWDQELLRTFSLDVQWQGASREKGCGGLPAAGCLVAGGRSGTSVPWIGSCCGSFPPCLIVRGLPDKKAVEDYLRLDIWWQGQGNDTDIGSGNAAYFFLDVQRQGATRQKRAVDDYLQLDVWWQGARQDAGIGPGAAAYLFLNVLYARGLPDKKTVEDYLRLGYLVAGSKARRGHWIGSCCESFPRCFSSRGLPNKKTVEDYLQLARSGGRIRGRRYGHWIESCCVPFPQCSVAGGFPIEKAVEDYLQDGYLVAGGRSRHGCLDRELLRAFSSMFSSRGFPR